VVGTVVGRLLLGSWEVIQKNMYGLMVVPKMATAEPRKSLDSDRWGTKVPASTFPQSGLAAKPDRM
jgi:hypothetical protein